MTDIILHHYPFSTFSEKVRTALDPQAGDLHLHFPRLGFEVVPV